MTVYQDLCVIILAAGKGTRMKSDLAKVLHKVAGKSMVCHVTACAAAIAGKNVCVVIGHQAEKVRQEVQKSFDTAFALQKELLGTGDAVKAALPGIDHRINHVLVLCGDVPLIQKSTLQKFIEQHIKSQAMASVLAVQVDDPTGYGRILTDQEGNLLEIKEEADATVQEKKVKIVNTGIYCFNRQFLTDAINLIQPENNQKEYYLTDIIAIARRQNQKVCAATMDDPRQVIGVNTLEELNRAEELIGRFGG